MMSAAPYLPPDRDDFDPYNDYGDVYDDYADAYDRRSGPSPWLLIGAGVALGALATAVYARRQYEDPPRIADDAPGRAARRRSRFGRYAVVGRSVTIDKPRQELYDFWRDTANLPKFMENLRDASALGEDRVRLVFAGPRGGDVEAEIRIVEDRPGELIAWRSTQNSPVDAEGRVKFRDAPGGRGTEVEAIIAWVPPGGDLGRLVAGLFQKDPLVQGRRELKRLKMLMETGEIADSRLNRAA